MRGELFGGESKRVAQHFSEIVPHQQRFVFVDRQTRVALDRVEGDAQASGRDAGGSDELANCA